MTYNEEAARFNWGLWELYRELQRNEQLSVARIASRFGHKPCRVRQHLEDGDRLSAWRK